MIELDLLLSEALLVALRGSQWERNVNTPKEQVSGRVGITELSRENLSHIVRTGPVILANVDSHRYTCLICV